MCLTDWGPNDTASHAELRWKPGPLDSSWFPPSPDQKGLDRKGVAEAKGFSRRW